MDFETYQPSFQNSMPAIYREKSIEFMRELHPTWNTSQIWEEAAKSFNETIKPYFEVSRKKLFQFAFFKFIFKMCSNISFSFKNTLNDKPIIISQIISVKLNIYFFTTTDPSHNWKARTAKCDVWLLSLPLL